MPLAPAFRISKTRAVCIATGLYATVGGTLTLLGWIFGVPRLTSWQGDGISMKVNTAVCAAASGMALVLSALDPPRKRLIRAIGCSVGLLGGLTLLEHLTGVDFGIDTLLFDEPAGALATVAPGRMGPPGATSFWILGTCLSLLAGGPRARALASSLATAPMIIAMLAMIGHLYGASQLYAVAGFTGIALQTATIVAALSMGLVAAVPEHGFAALLGRNDPGGAVFRRLVVPILLVPVVLGWLRVAGQRAGFYDMAFGTAARTLIEIVVLGSLLRWAAASISRHSLAARQSEDALREADRHKDEFLATLAHELRNPLAPLQTGLELLRRVPRDDARVARTVTIMDRQLTHMTRLIDDLLDVSRIRRGNLELRKQCIELSAVIESAIETSRPLLAACGHELAIVQPAEPIFIDGDLTRLSQVFANLLNNAAKYTDTGGRIELEVKLDGGEAVVSVRDNGVGIAADIRPRLFEMFTGVRSPFARASGGLGIGLALSKRLVEMHGGTIVAHSPPLQASGHAAARDEGSEFIVRLPILPPSVQMTAAAEAHEPIGFLATAPLAPSRLRILVADDNMDAADFIASLLTDIGHDVRTVHDGKSAVETGADFCPQVALLDIGMPELDGYQVATRIRAEAWGGEILLVALTGWGQPEDHRKSSEAGFDRHIVKPISLAALEQVLADARERQAAGPAAS